MVFGPSRLRQPFGPSRLRQPSACMAQTAQLQLPLPSSKAPVVRTQPTLSAIRWLQSCASCEHTRLCDARVLRRDLEYSNSTSGGILRDLVVVLPGASPLRISVVRPMAAPPRRACDLRHSAHRGTSVKAIKGHTKMLDGSWLSPARWCAPPALW